MKVLVTRTEEGKLRFLVDGPGLEADVEIATKQEDDGEQLLIVKFGGDALKVSVGVYFDSAQVLALSMLAAMVGDDKAVRVRAILEEPEGGMNGH